MVVSLSARERERTCGDFRSAWYSGHIDIHFLKNPILELLMSTNQLAWYLSWSEKHPTSSQLCLNKSTHDIFLGKWRQHKAKSGQKKSAKMRSFSAGLLHQYFTWRKQSNKYRWVWSGKSSVYVPWRDSSMAELLRTVLLIGWTLEPPVKSVPHVASMYCCK